MNESDVLETQDAALGKYTRLTWTVAVAKSRVENLAKELDAVALALRTRPDNIPVECYAWLKGDVLKEITEDLSRALSETEDAKQHAILLGVAIS